MNKTYHILNKVAKKGMSALLLAPLALVSCNDFLDQVPDERAEINTETSVVQLIASAYPTASYMWLSELLSDNIIDNMVPHMPTSSNAKQVLSHYNYGSYAMWDDELFRFEPATQATYNDWDSPGMLWNAYYSSIATVNHALKAIDELQQSGTTLSEKVRWAKAEALMIRAYCHFMLAQFFCQAYKDEEQSSKDIGIPYVTEVEDKVLVDYDRGTVADTYRKIRADLEAALPDITDQLYEKPKWHFNVNAAHAFAARFYLTVREWKKVVEQADAVFGSDPSLYTMNYSLFTKDLSTFSDFGKVWQNPTTSNNIMLMATYSVHSRRSWGSRYSCAGPAARAAFMYHANSHLFSGYAVPTFEIIGFTAASSSTQDYGMTTSRIDEEFEYSDKTAGIGYPHQILMPFTGNILLLERAEAKIMQGDYTGGGQDLMDFWNFQVNSLDADQKKEYGSYLKEMTPAIFTDYYSKTTKLNDNILADSAWECTKKNITSSYVIPAAAVPYMNCLNDLKRWETALLGMRYFDLKRWGMEWSHQFSQDGKIYEMKMEGNDPRRAVELPWEAISAGMQKSHPYPYDNRVEVVIKEESDDVAPMQ